MTGVLATSTTTATQIDRRPRCVRVRALNVDCATNSLHLFIAGKLTASTYDISATEGFLSLVDVSIFHWHWPTVVVNTSGKRASRATPHGTGNCPVEIICVESHRTIGWRGGPKAVHNYNGAGATFREWGYVPHSLPPGFFLFPSHLENEGCGCCHYFDSLSLSSSCFAVRPSSFFSIFAPLPRVRRRGWLRCGDGNICLVSPHD